VRTALQQITASAADPVRTAATGWRTARPWPAPVLTEPVQVLPADAVEERLVWCDQGVLIGRVDEIWVVSDPDLIENHGLSLSDNADLAVALLRELRRSGALMFDEMIHGHRRDPGFWQALGRFPLVLVPAHLLLLLAFTLWIARGRFGRPLAVPPAIEPGKAFLVDNIAALLRRGGEPGPSLRRYGRNRVRRAAELLHAPRALADDECRRWLLRRLEPDRRAELEQLLERAREELPPHRVVQVAQRIRTLTEDVHAVL
jgi:hypothetical protein